jgi:hypothetical protein
MKRITLIISLTIIIISLKAQTPFPAGGLSFSPWVPFGYFSPTYDSSQMNKKWSLSQYAGVSTGVGFFNGGYSSFFSVPVTLQLNRRLNNNLYAFAAASVAPSYVNFNQSFLNPGATNGYPGQPFNSRAFGMNAGFQMGLMYINDDRTFSISGSIGIERSSYPVYPTAPSNQKKNNR